jgi:hypothetical protein
MCVCTRATTRAGWPCALRSDDTDARQSQGAQGTDTEHPSFHDPYHFRRALNLITILDALPPPNISKVARYPRIRIDYLRRSHPKQCQSESVKAEKTNFWKC